MSNLFAALSAAGSALSVFQQAMSVSSNNVTNASVAGYAAQRVNFQSRDFDLSGGQMGGITAGSVESTRSGYAELSVQYEAAAGGYASARSSALNSIDNVFDVTGTAGIPAALSSLYQDFSSWATTPGGNVQRAAVLNSASKVADAFRQTAAGLRQQQASADHEIQSTVDKINSLAASIRDYNVQKKAHPGSDAGLDARTYQALEDLSAEVGITTQFQSDGTVNVLVSGQTPLVMGDQVSEISADTVPGTDGKLAVRAAGGKDITGTLTSGTLGGLLQVRNGTLASLLGGTGVTGQLDRLAAAFADRVNGLLESGTTTLNGDTAGVKLFTYDAGGAAASMEVNPDITASKLAAASTGASASANGIALALAGMADGTSAEDQVDGKSFLAAYSALASQVGTEASSAQDASDRQKQVLAHARELRSAISGVSLDQEAINMLEFQRAYEASARIITVVDELMQTVLALIK